MSVRLRTPVSLKTQAFQPQSPKSPSNSARVSGNRRLPAVLCSPVVNIGDNGDSAGSGLSLSIRDVASRLEFAAALDATRQVAGASVRSLATAVNTPPSTIGGWVNGRHLPNVRQVPLLLSVLRHLGVDKAEQSEWVAALHRVRMVPGPRPSATEAPYRGLEPFAETDSEWFFGRDGLADAVISRLSAATSANGSPQLIALVGGSGTGKSSFLRAGLLPRVSAGAVPGFPNAAYLTPGVDPVGTLGQVRALQESATLIIVDRMEELFTLGSSPAFCEDFVNSLAHAARRQPVIIATRSDFYGQLCEFPSLAIALENCQILIPPLTTKDLERVIVEPAKRSGVEVEPALVERLLRDFSSGDAGGSRRSTLPLLAHALLETWNRRRRGVMSLTDYLDAGGLEGAVEQTAENSYGELDADDQATAHTLFLKLVNLNSDGVTTRRALKQKDVGSNGTEEQSAREARVVDHFVGHRLLSVHDDDVEIAHEVLLSAWPRLRHWIDADREGLLILSRLREPIRAWSENPHDQSTLVGGARLDQLTDWVAANGDRSVLTTAEQNYLAASTTHRLALERGQRRRRRVLPSSRGTGRSRRGIRLRRQPGLRRRVGLLWSQDGRPSAIRASLRSSPRSLTVNNQQMTPMERSLTPRPFQFRSGLLARREARHWRSRALRASLLRRTQKTARSRFSTRAERSHSRSLRFPLSTAQSTTTAQRSVRMVPGSRLGVRTAVSLSGRSRPTPVKSWMRSWVTSAFRCSRSSSLQMVNN
jgi:hypothetical protein